MPNIVLRQVSQNSNNIVLRDPNSVGTNYANATLISANSVLSALGSILSGGIANLINGTSTISSSGNVAIHGLATLANAASSLISSSEDIIIGNASVVSGRSLVLANGTTGGVVPITPPVEQRGGAGMGAGNRVPPIVWIVSREDNEEEEEEILLMSQYV